MGSKKSNKKSKKSSSKKKTSKKVEERMPKANRILKFILEGLLLIFILILIYTVFVSIFFGGISKTDDIPNHVVEGYEQKGIVGIDTITPIALKIIVVAVCLTIAGMVIWNKRKIMKEFEKAISPYGRKAENLKITTPTIKEGLISIFAFLFWYIFNDAINNHAGSPLGIYEVGVLFSNLGVRVVDFIWIGFFGSFFLIMILVMRSQWKRTGTTPKYDAFMGLFAILSYFLMSIAVVAQLTGVQATSNLLWFGGISKATIYHIGVIMFIISLLYYAITE